MYLYLSDIDVRGDQVVERGQIIGRSGGQNSDEGPHVEFQIRSGEVEGGNPVALDPTNWLKRRR